MLPEGLVLTVDEIRELIKASGHTQREIARRVGVKESSVSKWKKGKSIPEPKHADKLRRIEPHPDHHSKWADYFAGAQVRAAANRAGGGQQPPVPVEEMLERVAQKVAATLPKPPDAEEISQRVAQKVTATLPKPPDAEEVAQKVVATMPKPPDAEEVAQKVVATMPKPPNAEEVAQKVVATMPKPPDSEEVSEKVAQKVAVRVEEQLAKKAAKEKAERKATACGLVLWVVGTAAVGFGGVVLVNYTFRAAAPACVTTAKAEAGAATGKSPASLGLPAPASPTGARARVSHPVPKEPFKGQMRPPCGSFTAINGGCWLQGAEHNELIRAPCPEDMYESAGYCFVPMGERGERLPSTWDGAQ